MKVAFTFLCVLLSSAHPEHGSCLVRLVALSILHGINSRQGKRCTHRSELILERYRGPGECRFDSVLCFRVSTVQLPCVLSADKAHMALAGALLPLGGPGPSGPARCGYPPNEREGVF
jgi:hypothetical protein